MKKRLLLFSFCVFAFYTVVIFARELPGILQGRFSFLEESHSFSEWFQYAGDLVLMYFLAIAVYLLLWRLHPRKQYLLLFVGILIVSIATFFFSLFWARSFTEGGLRMSRYFQMVVVPIAAQNVFAALFYFIRYTQYRELQQVELQLQNRQTELSLLRSQINPHFLFNHLNNIYSLVSEKNALALPAISELSELLRYMLYQSDEKTMLTSELGYLEKYISLQQLRFEHPSFIKFTQHVGDESVQVAPFLFIPFIENAFKHGRISFTETWLEISVRSDSKELNFSCKNPVAAGSKDVTGGIGLNNVQQRLKLLYPLHHRLEIIDTKDMFTINLQLQFGE